MPERLRRLEEAFQWLPIYFVTGCTHERQPVLNRADVHQQLVDFGKEGEMHGAWLGAYVLMPDHLHLFVVVDDQRLTLATWMKSLQNAVSTVLRANCIPAPHWQKGFFDRVLRSGDSYSAKWDYVRENPVRSGLVTD